MAANPCFLRSLRISRRAPGRRGDAGPACQGPRLHGRRLATDTSACRRSAPPSGESRGGISPPRAPRTVRDTLASYGSRCSAIPMRDGKRLCLGHRAPPATGWLWVAAEHCSPFGPVPLQNLPPSYELLRPCAPHRYSDPCGLSSLRFEPLGRLPLHRGDRFSRSIREPDPASRRLHAGCRSGGLQDSPRTDPGSSTPPRF